MIRKMLALLMALMLCVGGAALADDSIKVRGTATVQLEADLVYISMGVYAKADDVLTSQSEANGVIAKIVETLTGEVGIDAADIATGSYWIQQEQEYDYQRNTTVFTGYSTTIMLDITVREIDRAGEVIDAGTRAGANRLNSVEFASSDRRDARDRALKLAVEDAMRKAGVIAEAAGIELPKVPSELVEQYNEGYAYVSRATNAVYSSAKMEDAAFESTSLQSGMLSLTATVDVTYDLD